MSTKLSFADPTNIADFYSRADSHWLRVNMVLSLDGSYLGPSSSSRDLSSHIDLLVLQTLRLLSDAVVVGAKTAIGEKYRHTNVRPELLQVGETNPPFVIISESLKLDLTAPIFSDLQNKPHVITCTNSSPDWQERLAELASVCHVWQLATLKLDGEMIRKQLFDLGFNRVTCEGGPTLLNTMFATRSVQELAVTTSPTITGSLSNISSLGQHLLSFSPVAEHLEGDYLFQRLVFP